jgi:hypothetical protein
METALLIFLVLFAAAIGFFLGLFLLSLDSPLLKGLFKKDPTADDISPSNNDEGSPTGITPSELKKPTQDSRLILQIWKEEGQPPVYDLAGKYVSKDELPPEILNLITVTKPVPISQDETVPEPSSIEKQPIPLEIEDEDSEEAAEAEIKMLSVVDEVNAILQKKLHGSPLAGKGIHLMENHNKEIRFWVGLNSYNDVDEIPEEDIRQIIDEAVREWEQSRS